MPLMTDGSIDWTLFADPNDGTYRAEVLNTISRTAAGRAYLGDLVRQLEDLPFTDSVILRAQLRIAEEKASVSAFPLFAAIGGVVARGAARFIPVAKTQFVKLGPALTGAWGAFKAAGTARQLAIGISAVFATDYVLSKMKGNKPEVVKLYHAGRETTGTTLTTMTTLISMLPLALIAWGVYSFTKGRR